MSLTFGSAACIGVLAIAAAMSSPPTVTSRWKDRPIQVDGRIDEWPELVSFEQGVAVAAFNDETELFVGVATSDAQRRRQLLAAGMIVWLDPKGGKKQSFGIRIPGAGLSRSTGPVGGPPSSDRPDEGTGALNRQMPQPEFTYVEILGPGKDDRRRIELSAESDIAAAGQIDNGTLFFEIKIPLGAATGSRPHSLTMALDRPLGLGLETPRLESPQRGQRGGQGGLGEMGRRGGGGASGGRGGGMRARSPEQRELKLWTTVTFARSPGAGR